MNKGSTLPLDSCKPEKYNSKKTGSTKYKYSAFQYKYGTSIIHRCPSWIKILIIPVINILFFCLPPYFAAVFIIIQFFIAFSLHFTFREQFADVRAVLYYSVLLIFVKLLTLFFTEVGTKGMSQFMLDICEWDFWKQWLVQQKETGYMLLKLFCVMQSASIVFKTSTSLEIREGVGKIEYALTHKNTVTDGIFLFVSFIPLVSKIWKQSERAWLARGGKHSIKMYCVLLPVLFSVGMKEAYNKARAVSVRKG